MKEVTMTDVKQLDELMEIARRIEIAAEQLPEEELQWDDEKEKFDTCRLPPSDRELAAVDEIRDLADELSRVVWEARVALVGAELRAEKAPELMVPDAH